MNLAECRSSESRDKAKRDIYNNFSSVRYVQRWQKQVQPMTESIQR